MLPTTLSTAELPHYDVLLIGYGLLGNIAALSFAAVGLRVAVVERKASGDLWVSKAARLDEESLLILEQLGLRHALQSVLNSLKGTQVVDKEGRVLLELRQQVHQTFAPVVGFYQPDVQRILQEKAQAHPLIDHWLEHEAEAIEQNDQGVTLYVTPINRQAFRALSASFLLVCNGQQSRIAEALNIPVVDYQHRSSVLCVDTLSPDSDQQPYAQVIYNAAFPVTRITNNNRHQRWEFQIEQAYLHTSQTPEQIRTLLEELGKSEAEILAAYIYHFDTRQLKDWRKGRVLIVGDAAHVLPPYLGMSLAAGIKDVHNLAWKVALIQQGQAPLELLDTYYQERQPAIQHLNRLNMVVRRLFQSSRWRWLRYVLPNLPRTLLRKRLDLRTHLTTGLVYGKQAITGYFAPSPWVTNKRGLRQSLYRALSAQFVLIGWNTNPVDALRPNQLAYLMALGTEFIQITPNNQPFVLDRRYVQHLHDYTGTLEQWLRPSKAQYVLLRPDRIVYTAAAKIQPLNDAVRLLSQQLPRRFD